MSKEIPEDDPTFDTPLSTEYSTPVSSEVDLTMSRRELDPTLRGDRDLLPELPTGLLGTLEPGFEMAGNGMEYLRVLLMVRLKALSMLRTQDWAWERTYQSQS